MVTKDASPPPASEDKPSSDHCEMIDGVYFFSVSFSSFHQSGPSCSTAAS